MAPSPVAPPPRGPFPPTFPSPLSPPTLPPRSPAAVASLSFTAILATTLDAFDDYTFKHSIAAQVRSVDPEAIDVTVAGGSVFLTAFIRFTSRSTAEDARPELEMMLATPTSLAIVIGIPVTAVGPVLILPAAESSENDASGEADSDVGSDVGGDTAALTSSDDDVALLYVIAGGIGGLALLFVCVIGVVFWRQRRKSKAKKLLHQACRGTASVQEESKPPDGAKEGESAPAAADDKKDSDPDVDHMVAAGALVDCQQADEIVSCGAEHAPEVSPAAAPVLAGRTTGQADMKSALRNHLRGRVSMKQSSQQRKMSRPDPSKIARMIFDRYAKHGGDVIDSVDLKEMCKEMGSTLSDAEIRDAIEHLDRTKDGTVSFDEFLPWYHLGMKPETLKDVRALAQQSIQEEAERKAAIEKNASRPRKMTALETGAAAQHFRAIKAAGQASGPGSSSRHHTSRDSNSEMNERSRNDAGEKSALNDGFDDPHAKEHPGRAFGSCKTKMAQAGKKVHQLEAFQLHAQAIEEHSSKAHQSRVAQYSLKETALLHATAASKFKHLKSDHHLHDGNVTRHHTSIEGGAEEEKEVHAVGHHKRSCFQDGTDDVSKDRPERVTENKINPKAAAAFAAKHDRSDTANATHERLLKEHQRREQEELAAHPERAHHHSRNLHKALGAAAMAVAKADHSGTNQSAGATGEASSSESYVSCLPRGLEATMAFKQASTGHRQRHETKFSHAKAAETFEHKKHEDHTGEVRHHTSVEGGAQEEEEDHEARGHRKRSCFQDDDEEFSKDRPGRMIEHKINPKAAAVFAAKHDMAESAKAAHERLAKEHEKREEDALMAHPERLLHSHLLQAAGAPAGDGSHASLPNPMHRPDPKMIARQIFNRHSGGDSELDDKELGALCKELGQELTPDQLQIAIRHLDADGAGTISFDEFFPWYQQGMKVENLHKVAIKRVEDAHEHMNLADAEGAVLSQAHEAKILSKVFDKKIEPGTAQPSAQESPCSSSRSVTAGVDPLKRTSARRQSRRLSKLLSASNEKGSTPPSTSSTPRLAQQPGASGSTSEPAAGDADGSGAAGKDSVRGGTTPDKPALGNLET